VWLNLAGMPQSNGPGPYIRSCSSYRAARRQEASPSYFYALPSPAGSSTSRKNSPSFPPLQSILWTRSSSALATGGLDRPDVAILDMPLGPACSGCCRIINRMFAGSQSVPLVVSGLNRRLNGAPLNKLSNIYNFRFQASSSAAFLSSPIFASVTDSATNPPISRGMVTMPHSTRENRAASAGTTLKIRSRHSLVRT